MPADFGGKKVLEVGLGYGTLGQLIASRNADYYGADIAEGPVANMRRRLSWLGLPEDHAVQASVLELPFEDATFDYVYSIGCLHHTGDLERSVQEVHRVLVPGGRAVVMLYNRHSLRRARYAAVRTLSGRRGASLDDELRGVYDPDDSGEAAPHTDFVSTFGGTAPLPRLRPRQDRRAELRRLRASASSASGSSETSRGSSGLDLYIVADKNA